MSRAYKFKNEEGLYFVSFATVGWIDVFTRIMYKDIIVDSLKYCQKEKGLNLYAWVIMSNHIHLIAEAETGFLMPHIMRDLKKHTSKELIKAISNNMQESRKEWMLSIFKRAGEYNSNNKEYQFWQQDNRPIEIKTSAMIKQKLDYLHANPVVAGYVDKEEEYLYSSARDYHGTGKGLIDIMLLY
jgi:REP element-mobilizing transposase RayT